MTKYNLSLTKKSWKEGNALEYIFIFNKTIGGYIFFLNFPMPSPVFLAQGVGIVGRKAFS
jgi:hypothetical protein